MKKNLVTVFVFVMLIFSIVAPLLQIRVVEQAYANPNPNELRFAVISDIHFGQTPPSPYTEEQQMLETIYSLHPDFIIDCGDWIGNNVHSNWDDAQDAFQTRGNFTILHLLGNHDDQAYYQGDRNDDPPTKGIDQWIDEASGDEDTFAYLRDNILFVVVSAGEFTNNHIRWRIRSWIDWLLGERYTTQTWMLFSHNGMNNTIGHVESNYPQYKTGWWGSTEMWGEDLLSSYGSRCLGFFQGHVHFEPEVRNATWQYGTYHYPVGMKAEQYFWLVNITANGYTSRSFLYDGTEQQLTRMDNSTFTPTFNDAADDEFLIPRWCQDDAAFGQCSIFCLSESRRLDLVGVKANETYVNNDPWLENFEAEYEVAGGTTLRTWQGRTDYGNYWKNKSLVTGDDWHHVLHEINATTVPAEGWSALRAWSILFEEFSYYNISLRAKASVEGAKVGVHEVSGSPPTSGTKFVNWTLTTSYAWYYCNSTTYCITGLTSQQVGLVVWDNATYSIDFLGWRLSGVQDSDNTVDPSVTINGVTYNYTGTLLPQQNYTYSNFAFPSTTYDNFQSVSVGGNREVMVVTTYVNPQWRITNAAVSKSGSDIDTSTATSDYNNSRVIACMDSGLINPQFWLMRGVITAYTEPSWSGSALSCNVTGTGNGIFIVDVATSGNATSITENGTPISWVYDGANGLISFNVTLGSEHDLVLNFAAGGVNKYWFQFNFRDRDSIDVEGDISWSLFNASQELTYNEGDVTLTSGTYSLETYWHEFTINVTSLPTATYGNTTVQINLEMDQWTSGMYVGFNNTLTSLSFQSSAPNNITFTATESEAGGFTIILETAQNFSYITRDGVNQSWSYDSGEGIVSLQVADLSVWKFIKAEISWWYFQFSFEDLDSNDVETEISWILYNGSQPLSYVEGQTTLKDGTYTLNTTWHDYVMNLTSLSTGLYGNSSVTVYLQMDLWKAGSYLGFNNTVATLTYQSAVSNNITFTATESSGSSFWIILETSQNFTYISRAGVNQTWLYDAGEGIVYLEAADLSVWKFIKAVPAKFYFSFSIRDLDTNNVKNRVSWTLWNGSQLLSYTENQATLSSGSYTLNVTYRTHLINQTSLSTGIYGNTTVTIDLQMKRLAATNRWIAFNATIISITVHQATNSITNFTVTGSGNFFMLVDVLRNCSHVQKAGVNQSGWTYTTSPAKHVYLSTSSLSAWTFHHAVASSPSDGSSSSEYTGVAINYAWMAVTIWSISWIIVAGVMVLNRETEYLPHWVIFGITLTIVLFVVVTMIQGFSTL